MLQFGKHPRAILEFHLKDSGTNHHRKIQWPSQKDHEGFWIFNRRIYSKNTSENSIKNYSRNSLKNSSRSHQLLEPSQIIINPEGLWNYSRRILKCALWKHPSGMIAEGHGTKNYPWRIRERSITQWFWYYISRILKIYHTVEFLLELCLQILQGIFSEILSWNPAGATIYWNHSQKNSGIIPEGIRNHPWKIMELLKNDCGTIEEGFLNNSLEMVSKYFDPNSSRILREWCQTPSLKDSGNIPQEFWYYIRRFWNYSRRRSFSKKSFENSINSRNTYENSSRSHYLLEPS